MNRLLGAVVKLGRINPREKSLVTPTIGKTMLALFAKIDWILFLAVKIGADDCK